MGMTIKRAVFEESTDAFNRHDMEAFMATLADDVSCEAPGNVHLEGKEQVGSFYKAWIDGFPDAHVDIREFHETEDCVVEEGTFRGTHRGSLHTPGGDIPPTGRSVEARYVQVIHMDGERITSLDLTYDRLGLLEQLGVTESARSGELREQPPSAASPFADPMI